MMRQKDWTDEEAADVKAMRASGQSFYEIGRKYGVSHSKVREMYREKFPDDERGPNIDQTKLRKMWDDLASYREIGLAFGVTDDTVNWWRRKFNLPARPGKPPACNLHENRFTDAEKAALIRLGYSVGPRELAKALPGRSVESCQMQRRRMANAGLIKRPTKHLLRSQDIRSVTAKPRKPRVQVAKAAKPPRRPKPVRAVAPPLPPEPVVRDLPPNAIDRPIWRTLPEIRRMAMADRIVMTDAHDIQRYNKRRAEMGKQPVFISPGSLEARF